MEMSGLLVQEDKRSADSFFVSGQTGVLPNLIRARFQHPTRPEARKALHSLRIRWCLASRMSHVAPRKKVPGVNPMDRCSVFKSTCVAESIPIEGL